MTKSFKQSIEDFTHSVSESEELKNARPAVREAMCKALSKLVNLTFAPDEATDTKPVIRAIERILGFVGERIREVQEKTEPDMANIAKMGEEASAVSLDSAETEALMASMKESYKHTIETLKEFGYTNNYTNNMPAWSTIRFSIKKLNPEVIWRISRFGKPEVIVTPPEKLMEKFKRLDGNKKMFKQSSTSFTEVAAKHWQQKSSFLINFSIVDGAESMPPDQCGVSNDLGISKIDILKNKFAGKGLRMMTPDEYAMLTMKAIRDGHPIDVNVSGTIGPKTFLPLNRDKPVQQEIGPVFGFWHRNKDNGDCRMVFMALDVSDGKNAIRVRPAVDLVLNSLEYQTIEETDPEFFK